MSMNDVPSFLPTSAYSRPVSGSVHPQLSFVRTPRACSGARSSELGTNASSASGALTSSAPSAAPGP
jgi:hypothetical protein